MPFDGNGNWTSTLYPIDDRDNGVAISADKFNELIQNNLTQSFANCMTTDSQTKPIADIDANNYKVKNVADPTLPKDAVNKQTFEALTEDNVRVGNDSNVATETPVSTLFTNAGVYINKPINDTIEYDTATNLTWYGQALSNNDLFILETDSLNKIDITLPAGATADTTYFGFIGYDNDTDRNLIGEFDTSVDGSGLTNITGSKRRVVSIITNGSSQIIQSNYYTDSSGALTNIYDLDITDSTTTGSITLNMTIPNGLLVKPILFGEIRSGTTQNRVTLNGKNFLYSDGTTSGNLTTACNTIEYLATDTASFALVTSGSGLQNAAYRTQGYLDERNN